MYDFEAILERLRAVKAKSGLTTNEISNRSGVSAYTLNNLFCGRISDAKLQTMISISDALGTTVDYLATGRGPATIGDMSPAACRLFDLFNELNEDGQKRLLETADDMVQSKKYSADDKVQAEKKAE